MTRQGDPISAAPDPISGGPPAERLAERVAVGSTRRRPAAAAALRELAAVDRAVYAAVAGTPTPTLDAPLRRLSGLANHSKLWFGLATAVFALGGRAGRRAAATGVVAVGVNSALVNLPLKLAGRRARPDRVTAGVPEQRWVPMPTSSSFPSGHAASGFAFAGAVSGSIPGLGGPLRALAAAVGYSRVHTGVHYPGDVVIGSLVGATIGEATTLAARVLRRHRERAGGPSGAREHADHRSPEAS